MAGIRVTIVLAVCLLVAAGASAQQYAIGIRHGASFWMTKNRVGKGSLRTAPDQYFTYDKEVYLRVAAKTKWVYEGGISHYKFSTRRDAVIEDLPVSASQSVEIVDVKLAIQCDVTYPLVGYMVPALSKMKTYVGFATVPRVLFEATTLKESGEQIRKKQLSLLLAFTYTHVIPVSKKISLSSELSFSAVPFDKHTRKKGDFYNPNRRVGWHTGLQYKL